MREGENGIIFRKKTPKINVSSEMIKNLSAGRFHVNYWKEFKSDFSEGAYIGTIKIFRKQVVLMCA